MKFKKRKLHSDIEKEEKIVITEGIMRRREII
jgi:hypothetical protein